MFNLFKRKISSDAKKIIKFIDTYHIDRVDSYGTYRRSITVKSPDTTMIFIIEIWDIFYLKAIRVCFEGEEKRFDRDDIPDVCHIEKYLYKRYTIHREQRKIDKGVKKLDNKSLFSRIINDRL